MRIGIVLVALLVAGQCWAQKNFVPGYIIKSDGSKLAGYIDDRGWDQNPTGIVFREGTGPEISYSATAIREFSLDGGARYIGSIVNVDKSPYKASQLAKYNAKDTQVTDTIFLEILSSGKYDLLRLRDEEDKIHYYYRNGSETPKELILKRVFQVVDGKTMMSEVENYKGQLRELMKDCGSLATSIDRLKYVQREIMELFKQYDQCTGTTNVTQQSKKAEHQLILLAGLGNTKLKFKGISGLDFPASIDPTFGLAVNSILPRNLQVWSVYTELQYRPYQTNSPQNSYQFDLGYLRLNGAYRYNNNTSKLAPFAMAGFTFGYAAKYESNRNFDKGDYGMFAGLGLKPGKISAEARIENTTGMARTPAIGSSVLAAYLLISYQLK